jgi:hypothetical protein
LSARIGAGQAVKAAHALTEAGWTTADNLAATSWRERVRVLNRHGYARYDERTTSMLGDACELLLDRYRGDLRRLRTEAGQDPRQERRPHHGYPDQRRPMRCGALAQSASASTAGHRLRDRSMPLASSSTVTTSSRRANISCQPPVQSPIDHRLIGCWSGAVVWRLPHQPSG